MMRRTINTHIKCQSCLAAFRLLVHICLTIFTSVNCKPRVQNTILVCRIRTDSSRVTAKTRVTESGHVVVERDGDESDDVAALT